MVSSIHRHLYLGIPTKWPLTTSHTATRHNGRAPSNMPWAKVGERKDLPMDFILGALFRSLEHFLCKSEDDGQWESSEWVACEMWALVLSWEETK